MTAAYLNSFSYEQLLEISKRGKIPVTLGVDKDTLISVILEAFEEDRDEREKLNNLAMQMEVRKYSISVDEEMDWGQDDDLELPHRYNETGITLLLRDPSWIFCFWDLEDRKVDEIQNTPGYEGLVLRVVELGSKDYSHGNILDFFDIDIKFNDYKQYIKLPEEDRCYCVEIRAMVDGRDYLITRSNFIENTSSSQDIDSSSSDREKWLSGYTEEFGLTRDVPASQDIRQRIIPDKKHKSRKHKSKESL